MRLEGVALGRAQRDRSSAIIRIVVHTIEPAQRDAADEAELHQILDSIRIEPLS